MDKFSNGDENIREIRNQLCLINKDKSRIYRCWVKAFVFYLFVFNKGFSQDISIKHYSLNDGLPQGSVYEIYQAKNGIMWIGTGDGLCRYDGANYTTCRKNIQDKNGLLHNRIRKIAEDKTGNILISSDAGFNAIDAYTGKIITPAIYINSRTDSLFFLFVTGNDIYCVKDHTQLWCYHSKEKRFERKAELPVDLILPQQSFVIGSEIYYYKTVNELIAFDYKSLKIRVIKSSLFPIRNMFKSSGKLYVSASSGIYRLADDGKSLLPSTHISAPPYTEAFAVDGKQNFWISFGEDGLKVYDKRGNLLYDFPANYQAQKFEGISLKDIKLIYPDRSGNIWVGTEGNGIVKFNQNSRKFTHINYHPGQINGLSTGFIKCFYQSFSKGKVPSGLWIGTYLGGINFKKEDGRFIQYREMQTCFGIVQDSTGNLWVASDSGLFIMDTKHGRFKPFGSFLRGYSFCKLRSGEILFSDLNGSYIITPDKNNVFNSSVRPFKGCPANVLTFFETKKGYIIASIEEDGIYFSNQISAFKKIGLNSILEKATVRCVYEANDGTFYLATNAGLVVMEKELNIKKAYSIRHGLANEVLYSVVPDKKNNLWISSNKGISKFNIGTESFRNYTADDGIQSNEFNTGAWYIDTSGLIYMGGVNGYNIFDPKKIKDNLNTPTVMLSGLKIFDKDYLTDTVLENKKNISLQYNQNSLTFEFTAPEFTNYDKNQYTYKLSGVDKNWIMAGNRRYATYGNLAPGHYILMAKAANNDGVWGKEKKLLIITILPPWWRNTWFYLVSGILILVLIGLAIYRVSTKRLRKELAEMKRQQEIEAVRSRISRDIHDDVGAGLSHLALTSDLALMKLGKESELSGQLTELSSNSRKLIDSLGEIIWSVNPRFDDLNSMISYMRSFILEYLENSGVIMHIDISETWIDKPVKPEIRRNIFLVLKESLHNMVKHAGAKNVSIIFKLTDEQFELTIKDDGKGMDITQVSEFGNGMVNMKRRAEEIGGTLFVESKTGEGTSIAIKGTFM